MFEPTIAAVIAPIGPGHRRAVKALRDHVRLWNVAMDNRLDLPGYKYYLYRATGERPPVFVTFLNVEPRAGSAVNGLALRVADAELELYDERERNNERREVTPLMSKAFSGRVWTYIGLSRNPRLGKAFQAYGPDRR